jgi:hypothetical protein
VGQTTGRQKAKVTAKIHKLFLCGIAFAAAMSPYSAFADLPTTKPLVGTLVRPAAAFAYYGAATTHTNGLVFTAVLVREIRALARAPSHDGALTSDFAQPVADYVCRDVETEFRFDPGKGARGAVVDQLGTVFVQVRLVVEVLRECGRVDQETGVMRT